MAVRYKWDVEYVTTVASADNDAGEILDHDFCDSYAEAKMRAALPAPDEGMHFEIVLVRDDDNMRSWAYMEDGKIPEHFRDAYDNDYAKVPQRFHKEVLAA